MPRNNASVMRTPPAPVLLAAFGLGVAFLLFYVLSGLSPETWDYNFPRRMKVIAAVLLVSAAIGASSVIFQTITANQILTPSIMGLDNLYLFLQTLVVYVFGSGRLVMMNDVPSFLLTLLLMVGSSTALFLFMFRGEGQSVYFLVLVGLVFGTAFSGLSSFMQVVIDPSEFSILEGRMFASFNKVNVDLLGVAALVILGTLAWLLPDFRQYDVLTLGRAHAVNLGVNYRRVVLKALVAVAVLTSAATVLVGPITFLGILIVSVARFLWKTYRHAVLVPGTIAVGVAVLGFGMLITERVLHFTAPLSVIINFIGGAYFIYLLLRTERP